MCVNDILAQGAEPLFPRLPGCGQAASGTGRTGGRGVATVPLRRLCLMGGEMAEMPGFIVKGIRPGRFAVGVVEQDRIIDGSSITAEMQ